MWAQGSLPTDAGGGRTLVSILTRNDSVHSMASLESDSPVASSSWCSDRRTSLELRRGGRQDARSGVCWRDEMAAGELEEARRLRCALASTKLNLVVQNFDFALLPNTHCRRPLVSSTDSSDRTAKATQLSRAVIRVQLRQLCEGENFGTSNKSLRFACAVLSKQYSQQSSHADGGYKYGGAGGRAFQVSTQDV